MALKGYSQIDCCVLVTRYPGCQNALRECKGAVSKDQEAPCISGSRIGRKGYN